MKKNNRLITDIYARLYRLEQQLQEQRSINASLASEVKHWRFLQDGNRYVFASYADLLKLEIRVMKLEP